MSCCTGISRRCQEEHYGVVFRELTWSLSLASQLFGYSVGHGKPMDGGNIPLVCRQQAYLYSLSFSLRNPFLLITNTHRTYRNIPNHHTARYLVNLTKGTCRSKGQGVLMRRCLFHWSPDKKTHTRCQSEGRKGIRSNFI